MKGTTNERNCQAPAGGDSAFRVLVESYESEILAFTRALTRDEDEAESVAQMVFVRAYRSFHGRDASTPVAAWLYRLAFREAVLQIRIARFREALRRLKVTFAWLSTGYTETAEMARKNNGGGIHLGLLALPAKRRALLVLREVAHRSVPELAQIAGCEEDVVRERLYKARHDLSVALLKTRSKEAGVQC